MRVSVISEISDAYMYYNPNITSKYKHACHVSPLRHVGARLGSRGSATWPCVPRRTHVGPTQKYTPFFLFFLMF